MELNKIYNEDCLEGMRIIPDKSVDLVVTDPPYWFKKSPGKPYDERNMSNTKSTFANSELYRVGSGINTMATFTDKEINVLLKQLERVCKIMNCYICCSETQVPYYCMWAENNGFMFTILTWEKPLSIINKNRFSQNTEYVVRVYDYGTALNRLDENEYYNRVIHSKVITGNKKSHPTEKPVSLMQRFVSLSSKNDDLILDPFMGSGTTAIACIREHRNFIGFELNEEYYRKSQQRIANELSQQKLF